MADNTQTSTRKSSTLKDNHTRSAPMDASTTIPVNPTAATNIKKLQGILKKTKQSNQPPKNLPLSIDDIPVLENIQNRPHVTFTECDNNNMEMDGDKRYIHAPRGRLGKTPQRRG